MEFFKKTFFQKHGGKFKSVESKSEWHSKTSHHHTHLFWRLGSNATRQGGSSILKDISKKMMWRILCQLFWLLKKKDSRIWKKCDDILLSTTDNRPRTLAPIWIFPIFRALCCCCHSLSSFLFTMKHIEVNYQSTCPTWCESFITSLFKAIQFHVLCHFWNWIAFSRLVHTKIYVKLHGKWKFEAHFFSEVHYIFLLS